MDIKFLILIGVAIGAVFLLIGYKYGQEVGIDKGMDRLLSYIKVFDPTGKLILGIREMLLNAEKLSMEEKQKIFDKYLKDHLNDDGTWH